MKTEKTIHDSAQGAHRQAVKLAKRIAFDMVELLDADDRRTKKILAGVRGDVAELCQRIHEFNAYYNVLNTD